MTEISKELINVVNDKAISDIVSQTLSDIAAHFDNLIELESEFQNQWKAIE